jgi:rod shape-determining protein MreC
MLDIRRGPGYLFLAIMVAQVILVSAQVQSKSGVRVLQLVVLEVFSHLQSGTAGVVNGARTVWADYVGLRGVHVQNEALKRQVADLQVRLQQEHALAERSEKLQELLHLRTQATVPTLAADVIAGNPDPLMRTVTINRGSADGVQPDMAVIAPSGIVGRVLGPTARHAARVQLIIDRDAAAGALIERTRAGGMVVGADADPPLKMDLVSNLADVRPGDTVIASGVDGIFPNGYLIGRIEHADHAGAGLYWTITVRPAVDFSSLEDVLVVMVPPRPAAHDEAAK